MNEAIETFDFDRFESRWEKLTVEQRAALIETAPALPPRNAILPILAGLESDQFFLLKETAQKSLTTLRRNLCRTWDEAPESPEAAEGLKNSGSICAKLYRLVHRNMAPEDLDFLLTSLLTFGPRGAAFAFKAVYRGTVSSRKMEELVSRIPEPDRLTFVDQYLGATPEIRLKFGFPFKRILKFLHQREAIVRYYAGLFDRQKGADPFLNNISARLRNPDRIIAGEIASPFPDERILGLKALAAVEGRVSVDLLKSLLAESHRDIRITIYHIIEASFTGCYRDLCYPVLQFFYTRDEEEAIHAFRALVATGKLPPYRLLKMVRAKYPALLPGIYRAISDLPRFSFLIIQDIALNPEQYLDQNTDTNLACILGLVKKRPERILKLFAGTKADPAVAAFLEKTRSLLSTEQKSLVTEFNPVMQRIRQRAETISPAGMDAVKRQIAALKTEIRGKKSNFEGKYISKAKLSSLPAYDTPLLLNGSIISESDLSGAEFSHTVFRKAVFYNTSLRNARFDWVNFDQAVFINVDASGAQFNTCSFENASVYNSVFNGANLTDTPFLGALIVKTEFKDADLTDASFTGARVAAVNFAAAILNNTDFSQASARFCKFRGSGSIITDGLDFNARRFQVSQADIPLLPPALITAINPQVFCEFINFGERKFLSQNRLSWLTALDIFYPEQADLFQLIPSLLHENKSLPGMEDIDPATPCGIWNWAPSPEVLELIRHYIPGGGPHPAGRDKAEPDKAAIQGLFTIGSVGSIAQTAESDIDYWVCVDEAALTVRGTELLKQKLAQLERLARKRFRTEVTFFLVDIFKAKNNDFGAFSVESSGSAQSRLLKEEFYRTMIHVAGKLPLWAVLPSAVSLNHYHTVRDQVIPTQTSGRYIDLGDISGISTGEYFGGSLWQMFKSLKSPFKSVLKMALLEKFIFEYGQEPLLCNRYKDDWMSAGDHLALGLNDAYYFLMDRLLDYFKAAGDRDSVSLLLTCFFLKLGISQNAQLDDTVFGLRRILVEKCMREWGWTLDEVFRLGGFKEWEYGDVAALSNRIKDYMIKTYKMVNKRFVRQSLGRAKISPEDRTVLGKKIFVEFSKQSGRVERIFIASKNDQDYQHLHLRNFRDANGKNRWELFNRSARLHRFTEEILLQADTVEEIGLWLIYNRLYNPDTPVRLVPNPTYVTFNDIRNLFRTMYDFLRIPLEKATGFDQLLASSRVIGLFVSVNLYQRAPLETIGDYTLAWLNSWGELFYESVSPSKGPVSLAAAKKEILTRTGLSYLPRNTVFYSAKEGKNKGWHPPPDWDFLDFN